MYELERITTNAIKCIISAVNVKIGIKNFLQNGTNRLIWSYGATDEIQYHETSRRGSRSVSLLGAPLVELDLSRSDIKLVQK
jgi:hypothetical protein